MIVRLQTVVCCLILALPGCSSSTATTAPVKGTPRSSESPPPPCHPGCFPAGTTVETPSGPRSIETLRAGDVVLTVSAGQMVRTTIASVFAGQAELVEVSTDAGPLVTTARQPLPLESGEAKVAAHLTAGDLLVRWHGGARTTTTVRGVTSLDKTEAIFNLVLRERGTFIANGYLVSSKPPPGE